MTTARKPLGNVLVAIDLSTSASAVVERAARLPVTPGSCITLFHVLPPGPAPASVPDAAVEADAERALAAGAARIAELVPEGVDVFTALGRGTPFVEIIQRARDERAALVVLGRHGHRTFIDALIGSRAASRRAVIGGPWLRWTFPTRHGGHSSWRSG